MEDVSMQSSSQWNNPHEDPDASQSTQAISQELVEDNNGCWGLLVPADATSGDRIRLHKSKLNFTVGRDIESDLTLESKYISAKHAAITWNGREGELSTVVLYDYSRNGTYLIEEKVGRDKTRILNDGQQVVFGPMNLRRSEKDPAPSKYMFRDLVHVKRPIDADYDMQMKIGSGNFASVYKALEKRTGKWVAVKVIDHVKRFAGTAKGLSGALSEIQLLQKLHHTNVVKLFTYFDNPDFSLDIVFELVEGGNLESFIRRYEGGNGLSEWMACHMSDQICCATAFIHSQGITHRDLKPDNILLTTHEPPIVKVADFGVAKLVDQQSGLKTICGTIHYMAPEIVQRESADPPYTNLVDSWSVGAMIFCMYTGYPPWNISGNDMNQLRGLMATSGLLGIRWDLLEQNKLISSNARDFIDRLLMFDANERMSLSQARAQPWLATFKRAYLTDTDSGTLGRTASWIHSNGSGSGGAFSQQLDVVAGSSQSQGLNREPTVDPYAEDDDILLYGAPAAADEPRAQVPTRSRRNSRVPSGGRSAQAGPSRLSDIAEASMEPVDAPTVRGKGKGKAKAKAKPSMLVPGPDSADSSMYLYGNTGAAPTPAPVPLEPVQEDVEVDNPPSKHKRKREHDDVVAIAMGGDSLSSLSTLSSDGDAIEVQPKPSTATRARVTRGSSAAPGPPPAKRGRTADPTAKPPSSKAPRKPPPVSRSKPPSTTKGKRRATTVESEGEAGGSGAAKRTTRKR